jgi:hypothetical protein
MEEFLDLAWEQLYALIQKGAATLDFLLSYLHFLGPIVVIFFLAVVIVGVTKVLKKHITTKRYVILEKDFQHWLEVREEAMKCDDREKGRNLAKNIDKAHLNRAYYDYFLEGLLLGLITFYLPVVSMATYINEAYRAERLMELFGRDYIFRFGGSDPVLIGALFWFICAVLLINCSIFFTKWITKRYWTFGVEQLGRSAQSPELSKEGPLEQSGASRCA